MSVLELPTKTSSRWAGVDAQRRVILIARQMDACLDDAATEDPGPSYESLVYAYLCDVLSIDDPDDKWRISALRGLENIERYADTFSLEVVR